MTANRKRETTRLSSVSGTFHRQVLATIVDELKRDPAVSGVLLQGSVARGDHSPGSDLDLLVLLQPGTSRPFQSDVQAGILVETHHSTAPDLEASVATRPSLAYGIRDGQIQYDRTGEITALMQAATDTLQTYSTPAKELRAIHYWLYAAQVKLLAALNANDETRTGLLASINTWKTLEGLWAVNHLPTPPGGAVLTYLQELELLPPQFQELLDALITGTARERALACSTMITWLLEQEPA